MKDDLPSVVHASENPDRLLVDDVTSDSQVDHEARKQWYRETVSKRGIILLTEPEPEPEPQDVKPKQWSITVGGCLYEDEQIIKDALAVLYEVALPTFGICGNKNDHEKRKRVWMLLDQVSKELVDEVPSIEQLC